MDDNESNSDSEEGKFDFESAWALLSESSGRACEQMWKIVKTKKELLSLHILDQSLLAKVENVSFNTAGNTDSSNSNTDKEFWNIFYGRGNVLGTTAVKSESEAL